MICNECGESVKKLIPSFYDEKELCCKECRQEQVDEAYAMKFGKG